MVSAHPSLVPSLIEARKILDLLAGDAALGMDPAAREGILFALARQQPLFAFRSAVSDETNLRIASTITLFVEPPPPVEKQAILERLNGEIAAIGSGGRAITKADAEAVFAIIGRHVGFKDGAPSPDDMPGPQETIEISTRLCAGPIRLSGSGAAGYPVVSHQGALPPDQIKALLAINREIASRLR